MGLLLEAVQWLGLVLLLLLEVSALACVVGFVVYAVLFVMEDRRAFNKYRGK